MSDHFWKLTCRKSARRCGAKMREAHFDVKMLKCYKARQRWSTFGSWDVQSVTPLWREAHFQVKMLKAPDARTTFEGSDVVLQCGRKGFCTLPKVSKTWWFLWHLQKHWQVWDIWRGSVKMQFPWQAQYKRHVQQMLGGQGADFLTGVAFWSIRSSGLLRWFCVTGAALHMASLFVAGAVLWTGGVEKSQNALVRGRQLCTQLSMFEGSLAELCRFWCCQVQKWRKCRRIASFSSLQIDR